MSTPRLPVTVRSGFFGASKTALLNHMLANRDGLRVAVVANDLSDMNIDAPLVARGAWRGQRWRRAAAHRREAGASGFTLATAEGSHDRGDIVAWDAVGGLTHADVLQAVPEPEAWVLMPAGLAVLGLVAGGRKRALPAAAV